MCSVFGWPCVATRTLMIALDASGRICASFQDILLSFALFESSGMSLECAAGSSKKQGRLHDQQWIYMLACVSDALKAAPGLVASRC